MSNKKKEYYAEKKRKKSVADKLREEKLALIKDAEEHNYYLKKYFDCTGLQSISTTVFVSKFKLTKEQAQERFIRVFPDLKGRELK